MPDDPDDPIDELREQIRAAEREAQRLAGEIPPGGFDSARENREHADEVQALAALLQTLRDLVPADLQEQFREVMRQVLLLLRALVDWWLDRLERERPVADGPAPEPAVEDIPID
ncbi:MAG TPA: hypothetical protein VFZ89_16800 [Solirubrobacteraceae bacterium]